MDSNHRENEGYGLVTSIETALHHEAADSNTKMFQNLEPSARIAFETAQRACISKSVLPPDSGLKLLGKIASLRNKWLSDAGLAGE